jgi:hypothetical protein
VSVDPNVPVEDVIKSPRELLQLAFTVLDLPAAESARRLAEFIPSDLARVIEAKRNGVMDYGHLVRRLKTTVKYPQATDVITLLDKIEAGKELTPEDWAPFSLKKDAREKVLMGHKPSEGDDHSIPDEVEVVEVKKAPKKKPTQSSKPTDSKTPWTKTA